MLSSEDRDFISKEMKISLESIDSKLGEDIFLSYRAHFDAAISFFIKSIRVQNDLGYKFDYASFEDSPAEHAINRHYNELSEIINNVEVNGVLDSIRHAFCSFAYNGIHQLFTRQENEVWYPKVVLDSEIKPNDIDSFPESVVIYRGADISELELSSFGQSWTTKEQVAREFAFLHYESQHWFNKDNRVILKTVYPRDYVYYASKAPEFEVAIDTSRIGKVYKVA